MSDRVREGEKKKEKCLWWKNGFDQRYFGLLATC